MTTDTHIRPGDESIINVIRVLVLLQAGTVMESVDQSPCGIPATT